MTGRERRVQRRIDREAVLVSERVVPAPEKAQLVDGEERIVGGAHRRWRVNSEAERRFDFQMVKHENKRVISNADGRV